MSAGRQRVENLGVVPELASDAELISASRGGDGDAFSELYARHSAGALVVARQNAARSADAEDIVSEAFARIYRLLQEGKGPDSFFRAYLFTSIRNLAVDIARSTSRLSNMDDEALAETVDPDGLLPEDVADRTMVRAAFASLPERWRSVLWYAEVEGLAAAQIAPILGLSPNGTAALLHRAREGLRRAFLQQHISAPLDPSCRLVSTHLAAWARGALASRERGRIDEHLARCERCSAVSRSLQNINLSLRTVIAPAVLGGGAGLAAILEALRTATPAYAGSAGRAASASGGAQGQQAAEGAGKATGGTADAGGVSIQDAPVSAPSASGGVGFVPSAGTGPPLPVGTSTAAKSAGLLAKVGPAKAIMGAAVIGIAAIGGLYLASNRSEPDLVPATHQGAAQSVVPSGTGATNRDATPATDPDLVLMYSASGRVGATETGASLPVDPQGAASSSADLELPADARVSYALLQWANGASIENWTKPVLAGPDGVSHDIVPDGDPLPLRGDGWAATADVTDLVAAVGAGTWRFDQPAVAGGFAGWTLLVAYSADSILIDQAVAIYAGNARVEVGESRDLELDLDGPEVSRLGFATWGATESQTADGVWMTDLRSTTGLSQPLPSQSAPHQREGLSIGIDVFSVDGPIIFPHSTEGAARVALSFRAVRSGAAAPVPFSVGAVSVVAPVGGSYPATP